MSQPQKDYLNGIKVLNDERVLELELTIKSTGEAINQANKDLDLYRMQQFNCEEEITQLANDNIMLDEIITLIPDNA